MTAETDAARADRLAKALELIAAKRDEMEAKRDQWRLLTEQRGGMLDKASAELADYKRWNRDKADRIAQLETVIGGLTEAADGARIIADLRQEATDLRASLADMTAQRDAAVAALAEAKREGWEEGREAAAGLLENKAGSFLESACEIVKRAENTTYSEASHRLFKRACSEEVTAATFNGAAKAIRALTTPDFDVKEKADG